MKKLFLNGRIVPENEGCISPHDRGFLLGDGLFETLRAFSGKVIFFEDHWERLVHGAEVLNIPIPFSLAEMQVFIAALLRENGLADKDAGLRMTLTRGMGLHGLMPPENPEPTLLITVRHLASVDPKKTSRAYISSVRRYENSPLANTKTLNYLPSVLAQQEAHKLGADDALLLNSKGNLAEATNANLFIVHENKLLTPLLSEGALSGVTRKIILQLAQQLEILAEEVAISLEDLYLASEAFLTGSLRGVLPLIQVNERKIANGEIGKVTARLQKEFQIYINKKIHET